DALHAIDVDTAGKLRIAQTTMKAPAETVNQMVDQLAARERESERHAARIRQSAAWDLQIRGGYDKVFGQSQKVPAFGMITLIVNPGYFWQTGADERAIEARAEAAACGIEARANG